MNIINFTSSFSHSDQLKKEFAKRSPWITKFNIGGEEYGGEMAFDNDIRISQFFDNFPGIHSILDLGSLEGGQTFQLARYPGVHILGIEGRKDNIDRAEFVRQILKIKNVSFALENLELIDLTHFGKFDAVFCSGILYHLPEPWKLIEKIRLVSNKLFLWTHYISEAKANQFINGYRGWYYNEFGLKDPQSGLSSKSFWFTLPSLQDVLKQNDYKFIKIIDDNPNHQHGPCITLAVWSDGKTK